MGAGSDSVVRCCAAAAAVKALLAGLPEKRQTIHSIMIVYSLIIKRDLFNISIL